MNATKQLEDRVQKIHDDYSPFQNLEQQLFGKDSDDALIKIIDRHSQNLTTVSQQRLREEFFSWGPLEQLFLDESIFEIVINGPHHIYFENYTGFHKLDDHFLSPLTYRNFIQRLCQFCKTQYTLEHPFANGRFGPFRLHIAGPPVVEYPTLTLRRHQTHSIDLSDYMEKKIVSSHQYIVLKDLVETRANFLVVGNTGSGKTTLLNSLIRPLTHQRLLFIEDTEELVLPNTLSLRLLTRKISHSAQPDIGQQELLKQALRMRPDRIIMGEIRDHEAKDFLQTLATGHEGSMGTLHANTAQQAIYRLEMLIQMGAPQWNLQAIRRLMQISLQYIVLIQKQDNQRKLEGIYRLANLEKFGFLLEKVA